MNNILRDAAIACAFAFTFGATRAGAQDPAARRMDRYVDTEAQVTNYRKSLALDPRNENARAMLEKLGR